MSQRTAFIINAQAGRGVDEALMHEHRPAVDAVANGGPIRFVSSGEEIVGAVREALAAGCSTIVAGGGDGTLNAVASRLVGTDVRLGVLPLGTLNHFAKDLGIPLEPAQALQTVAAGEELRVDVGEVNGHHFLNNSSIGLYPDIVRDRERQQSRLGRGKWVAFAWAMWGALRRFPFLDVRLMLDGAERCHRTPFVFVGNNAYQMTGFQIGSRECLTDGKLSIYLTERPSRLRLFGLGLRALAGRLRQTHDFRVMSATSLSIATHHRSLRVATDGEVRKLDTPLNYRLHAGALRVIVPKRVESQAPAAVVEGA
jgi:diacylglycerol kinase family enzyme